MIIGGRSLHIFSITTMPYFSQSKAPNIPGRQPIMDKLLVELAFGPVEVDDGLGVEEESDIRPDAETWIEVVGGMHSDGKGVIVLLNIDCVDGPQLVVLDDHLRPRPTLLLPVIVLDVSVLEDVLIVSNHVKALIHYLSVFLAVNVVSHLISLQRIRISVLNYAV